MLNQDKKRQINFGLLTPRLVKPKFNFNFFKISRIITSLVLILTLVIQNLIFNISPVYSASSPWTQNNWNGGSGQTSWSDSTRYSSSSSVTTSTANQVTLTQTSSWYNASWAYRKKITFDNSAQAENLTNFPVLVKLSSSNFDFSKAQSSGQDVRFTDSDGTTALSYEIESYSNSSSAATIWVKVPQINASSSTDYIYVYFGNSSATDGQAGTSVWDSNYKLVQHLKETSGTTTSDSTSNGNNGTKVSATEPNPTTLGQINGAQSFDGSNDYISTSLQVSPAQYTSLTMEAWVKPTANATSFDSILNGDDGGYDRGFGVSTATYEVQVGNTSWIPGPTHSTSRWDHVVVVYTPSQISFYQNGTQYNYGSGGSFGSSTLGLLIGEDLACGSCYYNGTVDEVRISNTARSAAWIAASYKSGGDTFNTFASEEQQYPSSGTLTSSIFDTEYIGITAWETLTFSATTPSSTTATVKVRTSNSSSMSGATAFSSCDAITSGTDISNNNCVTNTHRYAQYLITLSTSVPASTPIFNSFSLAFAASDADAPSISLTALSPDPTTDTTPTLSGSATDSLGTVSNVQFQMDATSGSWSSCSSDDGTYDEATETFTCTSSALPDGSHTMYVRATDSNGNTTSSSYASDTFTIDATNPVSIDLDSPGDNSYTNSERFTFRWKATTDASAGLSNYALEIDNPSIGSNQPSGDFTIDNIPTSGTTDITSNNKYVIHFEGFDDIDSNNNYISVYTRSTSDWSSSENDGKLREGRVSWKVKVRDNAGNETSSSRILFVDRTSPNVVFTKINSAPYTNSFSTTDKTPTIFGKITDPLAGGDPSQTQSESGPKVASGPKEVTVKVEKKAGLTFKLITLYKINMDTLYYICEEGKTIDNSKQKCDKYLSFEYTPKENLDFGTYKITLTGQDVADNPSSESTLSLIVTTLSKITTSAEKKIIEEETKELPPEQKEQIKEELEITKPTEEAPKSALEGTGNVITTVFAGFGKGAKFVFNGVEQGLAIVFDKTGQGLALVGNVIGAGLHNTGEAIGAVFNSIANNAPQGVAKNILLATGTAITTTFTNTVNGTKEGIANLAFAIGEKADIFSSGANSVSVAIVRFGYLFATEPTRIYDVQVVALSPTSAKISWQTNHPANGKVNYGLDETYPLDIQTDKRTTYHEFTLTNLTPNTQYHFEVMSQNKNYVYDANRKFKTPAR